MAFVSRTKEDLENELILRMLNSIENEPEISQRALSSKLGVAIGMVNAYMKRCTQKGLIKVQNIPSKRFAYYLTPTGFLEKTKLTVDYLKSSFSFLREAQTQLINLFEQCESRHYRNILIIGQNELADIASTLAKNFSFKITINQKIALKNSENNIFDCCIIVDIEEPQACYEFALEYMSADKILTPSLLNISKNVLMKGAVKC